MIHSLGGPRWSGGRVPRNVQLPQRERASHALPQGFGAAQGSLQSRQGSLQGDAHLPAPFRLAPAPTPFPLPFPLPLLA